MARHLDKDSSTYSKERDGFIRDLQQFHGSRGTPFRRCPTIGGHPVDLYLLYSLVTQQGGWMKVNSRNEWESIFEQFDLPAKCVNSGVALKQVYIRYLDRYEKVHFLGEEADRGSDEDEESRHKRWSARALHTVPLSYNYHQHNIADSTRAYNCLSTTLYKPSDYDRLALSLISPLPNEQDFAVNVCTLMCNEGKHTLRLDRCPRLIDYLLAHTGIFNHASLRQIFTEVYSDIRKHSLNHFWYDVLESSDLIYLANENNFILDKKPTDQSDKNAPPSKWQTKNKLQEKCNKTETKTEANAESSSTKSNTSKTEESQTQKDVSECEKEKCEDRIVLSDSDSDSELFASEQTLTKGKGFKLKLEPSDRELFCTGRTLGTQDYVGQRVLQIAHILRNLSFTEDNVSVLATNRTFLRFLLLCVSSRWNSIHQLGLDMLSNIATELSLKDQNERITECLINFVTNGLHSQDRVVIIACLEILNKLSQRESNEEFMIRSLEPRAYVQVCSFLTLHDVMLLIYTLECLYALSSLGERACNIIVDVHGIIDTLVSLVTVEGKSYGPKACIGMKLVETVPGVLTTTQVSVSQQQSVQTQPATAIVSSSTSTSHSTTPLRSVSITPRNIVTASSKTVTSQASTQQQSQQQAAASTTVTPQQFIQQQHAHQQAIQENEQFALAWLRATYEPCGHGRVEQQELYKQYLNSCSKIGRRGVIAPLHFPRCVRSVFGGTVGPNPVKNVDPPSNLLFYEGVRPRIVPLIITLPSAALQHTVHHSKMTAAVQRRKATTISTQSSITPLLTTDLSATTIVENTSIPSPASPILKAQLSAPPKPKDSPTKVDVKSQVLAHPHLSQALLGNNVQNSTNGKEATSNTTAVAGGSATASSIPSGSGSSQSSTSLIKSLLATKVNECMLPSHAVTSMKSPAAATAGAQDSGLQVAQRQQQQRLLAAQQNQQLTSPTGLQTFTTANKKVLPKPQPKSKILRMNGIRLAEAESSGNNDNVSPTSTSTVSENHYQPPPATVISGVGTNSAFRGRREPPQPPPPPLAPLSTSCTNSRSKTPRMDIEDSDSTGNNSVASSTGISSSNVAVSSTEDGENSLTSFEGILLNGIPNSIDIDAPCNDDSNSKDSIRNVKTCKPLMLADLLEKKVEKDPPILNGVVCKELRIGDKGLELVDNHINKILNKDNSNNLGVEINKEVSVNVSSENSDINSICNMDGQSQIELKTAVKRSADNDISEVEVKKRNLSSPSVIASNNLNGIDSPKPESMDSNGDDGNMNMSVSATAANLYASLAADVLEDEDEELLLQQGTPTIETLPVVIDEVPVQTVQQTHIQPQQMQVMQGAPMQQIIAVGPQNDQQLIVTTPRQIIVSQGQIQSAGQQVLITAGGQITLQQNSSGTATIKTASSHQQMPMLVQTSSGTSASNNSVQQRTPVVLSQAGGTPIHLVSHGSQVQLVQAAPGSTSSQTGQYVLQAAPGSGAGNTHYVVTAQPQTALVQGTPQTVLVAQTPQQQGTPTKTIIILQPQAQTVTNTATHHQKVVVTPQGQQVVVTQVQRPILQSSTVTNNIPPTLVSNASTSQMQGTSSSPIKSNQATVITQNSSALTVVTSTSIQNKTCSTLLAAKDRTSRPQTPVANIGETSTSPQPPVIRDYSNPFICEWRGCTITKRFKSANEVYMHACEAHCSAADSNPGDELQCLWDRCDTMKRKRFSLMTHLHDRHCSPDVMKAVAVRRRQLSQTGKTEIPAPTPPPPHPGYAPDAALHAIKRHALEFVNPKELQQKNQVRPGTAAAPARPGTQATEQDDNEGPVTKSIRLTASLILRNLVIYSNNSRRYLRHYEPHLAGVALSNVESSRTIAQLLYDMNDASTSRR